MRKWVLIIVWLVWPAIGSAAGLKAYDFAYGLAIDVPPGTAVAALSLPQTVYTMAVRSDLGDIRVFNAQGEPVPHLLRTAHTDETERPWQTLPFFPLPEAAVADPGGYRVMVKTGPDGALVAIDPGAAPPVDSQARSFLVDVSRLAGRLAELRLTWPADGLNRMTLLRVETSDDLVAWSTVAARWAVASIDHGGRRLYNNTLVVTSPTRRYLRLQQIDAGAPLLPTRIEGRKKAEPGRPVRAFLAVAGKPDANQAGVFLYTLEGAFPVDRVNLLFDQANSVADAVLESRSDPKNPWRRRTGGLFYRIDQDTTRLDSPPQAVSMSTDRFWRLTVNASDSTIGSHVPRLHLGYRPHNLFFIARGEGRFVLAFGSAAAEPASSSVGRLFDDIRRQSDNPVERWLQVQGPRFILGGPEKRVPLPAPLPVRRIVLWSILLAGVLVVAGMAWRLARRMR
jgi:hypothetical protein